MATQQAQQQHIAFKDERSVIATYKRDNMTDPDVIYVKKNELLDVTKEFKMIGWITAFIAPFGLLLFVIPGFLMIWVSIYYFSKAKNGKKNIESGTSKYCKEIGIEPI